MHKKKKEKKEIRRNGIGKIMLTTKINVQCVFDVDVILISAMQCVVQMSVFVIQVM